jgi:outer membrane lipoprotein SlyB
MNLFDVTGVIGGNVFTVMSTNKILILVAVGALTVAAGCTFPSTRRTIPRSQAGQLQTAEFGSVTSAREVNIEGERSQIGLFGGGAIGAGAAKPAPGSGRGAAVAQAGGAVAGAVVGQAVEEVATRKTAQEITVRLDDGRVVIVTQDVSDGLFRDGDRVQVVHGGGGARITLASN